jgi:hypothetical protein
VRGREVGAWAGEIVLRIYIAGQITGLEFDVAFRNFEVAEAALKNAVHEPVNPMKSEGEVPGRRWAEYLADDLLLIDKCDAIYMQSNWQMSKGARLEHEAALLMDKTILYEASQL